jgi:hypothetical protein
MPEQQLLPQRVVSGGQTGADQAGLIVARRFGPDGRLEAGPPSTPSRGRRSEKNPVWHYPSGRLPPG